MASDPPLICSVRDSLQRGLENLARRQSPDGAWPGDYGGPMFLLPMYVALAYAANAIPESRRRGFLEYFENVQGDGDCLGLHAEDRGGSMFATALGYVAQRLLGVDAGEPRLRRLRAWIAAHGSPLGAASWGKFTLCLLGLYDWRGIHPVPPEIWLLPRSAPIHPSRLWCHCRQVYLPMAWLYGRRATVAIDPLLRSLRDELYGAGEYDRIAWASHRDTIAAVDSYRPATAALRAANAALDAYERLVPLDRNLAGGFAKRAAPGNRRESFWGLRRSPEGPNRRPSAAPHRGAGRKSSPNFWRTPLGPARLREQAMERVLEHVRYEDRATSFIDIGPVNKVLNAFVHLFDDPRGDDFRRAFAACDEYLWTGHDGTKMQSYNSSKLWDTAFALQSVLAAGALGSHGTHKAMVERAYGYVRDHQILEDPPEADRFYRHSSRGGWPFSSRAHGWPITDCTSEGLKCALALEGRYAASIPEELLRDSVRLLLSWQNDDGGWATYERQRGSGWLEFFNPSQVFGDIMVDYSYVECTSACLQALAKANSRFSGERGSIERAIDRGQRFIRSAQRADGSFEGSWGVCFVYGTWFGVSGLLAAGASPRDPAVERACAFLLGKQRADGSWGEAGESCRLRRYVEAPAGGATQTAWALSALVRAGCGEPEALRRAARWLVERQRPDGAWSREPMVGVFNRTCLINYDNYRHYFPLWALAEWAVTAAEPRFGP